MDSGLTALKGSADGVAARIKRPIVCGGRDYDDIDHIHNTLFALDAKHGPFECVVHGCARGVDTQAMGWAVDNGRLHAPFLPDWHQHDRAAGPIRNQRMIDEGRADACIAFPGGRGTADMVRRAKAAGLTVIEVMGRANQQSIAEHLKAPTRRPLAQEPNPMTPKQEGEG